MAKTSDHTQRDSRTERSRNPAGECATVLVCHFDRGIPKMMSRAWTSVLQMMGWIGSALRYAGQGQVIDFTTHRTGTGGEWHAANKY